MTIESRVIPETAAALIVELLDDKDHICLRTVMPIDAQKSTEESPPFTAIQIAWALLDDYLNELEKEDFVDVSVAETFELGED